MTTTASESSRVLDYEGPAELVQLPAGWARRKNKEFIAEVNDRSETGEEELLTVSHITGVTPRSEKKDVTMTMAESLEGYKRVHPGDFIINTMWAWMGAVGVTSMTGLVSPSYNTYRFRESASIEPRYFNYLFRSKPYVAEMTRFSQGVWKSRRRLYPEQFLDLRSPFPPVPTQRAIANFLDQRIAAVDELIAKKERLLELLEEKRAALINRAVTRGLDPDVPMMDSGVPWIGEIPEHWEMTRAKFLLNFLTSGSRSWSDYFSDSGAIFFISGNIGRTLGLDFSETQYVDPPRGAEGRRTRIHVGDVAVCITGARTGSVGFFEEDIGEAYVNQHVALLRPDPQRVVPDLLALLLWSDIAQTHFTSEQYGGTKQGLGLADVGNCPVPLPPINEQRRIADQLTSALDRFAQISALVREEIARLVEYRQSLITAAVTGQLEVEAENQLPKHQLVKNESAPV